MHVITNRIDGNQGEKEGGGGGKKQKCGAVVTDTGGIVSGGTHLDSILDTQP